MKNAELRLLGCDGNVIYEGRITNLAINEELILNKSMELFSDPAPCFIHRSAVMKRLYLEAEDYLENGLKTSKTEWMWEDLPYWLRQTLKQDIRICRVKYIHQVTNV